jgi:predicted nucleotidyltransferase
MNTTHVQRQSAPLVTQEISSPSVSVFWLDLNQIRHRLKVAVQQLAQTHPEIEEVRLFGSLARGDAVPGSDADLIVVLSDTQLPFLDRFAHYQPDFCGIGVDVLAYTRAELAQMRADGNVLLRQAWAEGVCLFQRTNSTEAGSLA